jgi:hypothetical protein
LEVVFDGEGVFSDEVFGQFAHAGRDGIGTALDDRLAPTDKPGVGFDAQKEPARGHLKKFHFGDVHTRPP